jgi:hypothetical protein
VITIVVLVAGAGLVSGVVAGAGLARLWRARRRRRVPDPPGAVIQIERARRRRV